MNVKCLIFDMDGLMFDSERIAGEAYKRAAKEHGYDVKDETRYQLLGRSKTDGHRIIMELMGEDYPAVEVGELSRKYKDEHINAHGLPVKRGLVELLDFAKGKGMHIAVASSSDKSVIEWYLGLTNLTAYFDFIISGDQVVHSKPNPEIFLKVCSHFNIDTSEALVLEDSKSGILAAVNGNIPVICIPDILEHEEDITKLTYRTLPDLSCVIDVLQ
ncbi:MAG: HAD family hydrolase [Coprobacillaceae bacterium]